MSSMSIFLRYDKPYQAEYLSRMISDKNSGFFGENEIVILFLILFFFTVVAAFLAKRTELAVLALVFLYPVIHMKFFPMDDSLFEANIADVEEIVSIVQDEDYKRVVFVMSEEFVDEYIDKYLYLDEKSLSTKNYKKKIGD